MVADIRFQLHDRIVVGPGDAELAHRDFHVREQAVNLTRDVLRERRAKAGEQGAPLETQFFGRPTKNDEGEEHGARGCSCDGVEAASGGHADGRFNENGGGDRQSNKAGAVFEDGAGAEKADAGANSGGSTAQVVLDANESAHAGRKEQAWQNFVKRNHPLCGPRATNEPVSKPKTETFIAQIVHDRAAVPPPADSLRNSGLRLFHTPEPCPNTLRELPHTSDFTETRV